MLPVNAGSIKGSDRAKIDRTANNDGKELVAVFSDIILQKRVLDAGQLFPSAHVWNDRLSFTEKIYRVKGRFFNKIQLLIIYSFQKRNQGRSFQT